MDDLSQQARAALRRYQADAGLGARGKERVWEKIEGSLAQEARPRRGKVVALTVALSLAASVVFAVCGLQGGLAGTRHVDAGAARYEAVPASPAEAVQRGERARKAAAQEAAAAASVAEEGVTRGATRAAESVRAAVQTTIAEERGPAAEVEASVTAEERGLAAEVAYMRAARAAIDGGDGAEALRVLSAHALEFPAGQMLEDRLRLRIEALCGLGRAAEARAEAAAFLRDHPGSTHAGRVRGLCADPAG